MVFCRKQLFAIVLCMTSASAPAQPSVPGSDAFVLRDFIGRTWRNESVRFPASAAQLQSAQAGLPLVGPDGKPTLYQVVPGRPASIEFLADLDPLERRDYRFAATTEPAAVTDLAIEETPDLIRLSNSRVGIALRTTLRDGEGPIAGIRLASGRWVGNSLLFDAPPVQSYRVEVTARGPAFVEVVCDVGFGGARNWRLRFRLQSHEPAVLADETFALDDGSVFKLLLSPNFMPDALLYRTGKSVAGGREGKLDSWTIPTNYDVAAFVLEPWLHWWERERQGTWFALYQKQGSDLLAIAARAPALWVDPAKPQHRATSQAFLTSDRAGLKWTLSLKGGARAWMIVALDKETSLAPLRSGNRQQAPLPQQHQIKHSDFPLNRIKDYVLEWPADDGEHPRLAVTKRSLPAACRSTNVEAAKLAQFRTSPVSLYGLDEPVRYYLCSKDADLGRHLVEAAVSLTQDAVDMLLRQDMLVTLGFAPHIQVAIMAATYLADAVWSDASLSPAMRARLRAQLVFLAYTVNRDDYWSPPRRFSANPNMTSTVAAYRALLGAMLVPHPMAKAWLRNGVDEMKSQLDFWADGNGGWLEAPHYATLSFDYLLGVFLAAQNVGFEDLLFDPKIKKVADWLAKISTPPDSAAQGHRHLPPIGNTYIREPSGQFGLVANLWQHKDPDFAAHMQWMFRQQGSPPSTGIGGFNPIFSGFRLLLRESSIEPQAPAYGSEFFPNTGAMLRAHFPTPRETQLYLIAGVNHDHYDMDSGSFTLWGKGRLVANDFGYAGYMPADDHNMVVAPSAPGRGLMQITAFSTGEQIDYVRGLKNDAWTRQIAFIKDADPLGPNYFVVADTMKHAEPAVWRLWLTAARVDLGKQGALVVGNEDVDTDIRFIQPPGVALATEQRTHATSGMTAGKFGGLSTTQTGLIARDDNGAFTALIYPRLKSEAPPIVTALAGGKAVKVETAVGADFVFLSATPFSYRDDNIAFSGTAGLVRVRGDNAQLALGAAGSLSAFGRVLHRNE